MNKNIMVLLIICFITIFGAETVYADSSFDTENLDKGVVGAVYKSNSKLKIKITYKKESYTYNLNGEGTKEFFPLQMGNGSYKVSLYQNTAGSSYKLIESINVDLNLDDQNVVYLGSTQNINWELNPKTIKKAVELTKDTDNLEEKAKILWNFMIKNNEYDHKKLDKLPATYLPIPDITLEEKTGICYDFSSLYASMLRSEGIPAKLVKGYAPDYAKGYHAWNEVYDESKKEWFIIDSTYDIQLHSKKSVEMRKKAEKFKKVYEY